MSKVKKHRVKQENTASSSSNTRPPEELDLAYFIHDRVELMHQVFSVLKSKELKALAPECVRRLSTGDLQELCLEELLGISSKRLCAILDGAEPPSDTESSSQSLEHLETISLDSISSDDAILNQGVSKKKKHRRSKKKRKKRDVAEDGDSRASRAGLTVLELLELQARARAIRAQLHQVHKVPESPQREASSDNEVEIKEEKAEVVEISSDEGKPDLARLQKELVASSSNSNETAPSKKDAVPAVTKIINDLIITIPQSTPTRRIKLKRQKPTVSVPREETTTKVVEKEASNTVVIIEASNDKAAKVDGSQQQNKSKKYKKKKKKSKDKGSDQDEITLQLSDTEKMDLLEDLDAKNLDNVSSSDSDSSNDQQNTDTSSENKDVAISDSKINNEDTAIVIAKDNIEKITEKANELNEIKENVSDLPIIIDEDIESQVNMTNTNGDELNSNKQIKGNEKANEPKSDGEISDRESSEVEVSDIQPEVVCVSGEESKKKKKKKKEKKSKKEKTKAGFQESKDNNFYKDGKVEDSNNATEMTINVEDDDDVYEILEISDDSSCYEVEGVSVLSKEPTAQEIEAISARMDEIEIAGKERVITNEKEITLSDNTDVENVSWKDRYLGSKKVKRVLTTSNILNAIRRKNIELKKKLEESKKQEKIEKLNEQSKVEEDNTVVKVSTVEDGSIEQYETLEGSTKYVDPVKENEEKESGENDTVTKEMKKDAKMLLKMYKRLLKYNDINKQKDPSKKKKKQKKSKDKDKVKGV